MVPPIVIVILQINPYRLPYCTLAKPSWDQYASAHGYQLHWIYSPRKGVSPKLQKYVEVLDRIREMPDGGLVLLSDCDVVITNSSYKIEEVWMKQALPRSSLLVAKDPAWKSHGIPINSGMLMVKNTAWLRSFFSKLIQHGPVTGTWKQWELLDQPILTKMLVQMNELTFTHWGCCFNCHSCIPSTNMTVLGSNLKIVENRAMNSIMRNPSRLSFVHLDDNDLVWKTGDWTAHITGSSVATRVSLTKKAMALAY